jgi:hypothetical protein
MHVTIDREKDDPPSTTPTPAWCGWFRPHRGVAYVKIAEAADYGACWGLVLDELARRGQRGGDSVVMPAGVDANESASVRRPTATGR